MKLGEMNLYFHGGHYGTNKRRYRSSVKVCYWGFIEEFKKAQCDFERDFTIVAHDRPAPDRWKATVTNEIRSPYLNRHFVETKQRGAYFPVSVIKRFIGKILKRGESMTIYLELWTVK